MLGGLNEAVYDTAFTNTKYSSGNAFNLKKAVTLNIVSI